MTKTQKENIYIALVIVGLLFVLWLLHKHVTGSGGGAAGETAGTTDPTSDQAPYYLTFNQPSPGATNLGAPYYGPISINNGCGCDQSGNNITAAQVAAQTGNNYDLTGAASNLIPGYITTALQIE